MIEWKEVRLGDVGKIITGKTPKTNKPENYGDEIMFLTPSDDMQVKRVVSTNKRLSNVGLNEVKNCLLPKNTICVSCIGSDLGKVVIINDECVTNQQINSLVPNNDYDTDFLYYSLTILGEHMNYISKTSTAVPIINKTTFSNFEIKVPNLNEQKAISGTLSSLDEMIELNNRTIKVLEEMSQVLYKSWFVNFDFPNQEGKPYKLSGGEMVESEIGLIPKGWKIAELGDVTTNLREKTKSNDYKVLSAVNTGNLMLSEDYFTKQVFSKDLSKYIIVKQKDFAYNPARVNIGSIGMNEFDFDGCVSPVYVAFRPEEGYHWFFHIYVKSNNFNDEVNKRASGSVRQALNYGDFALIKIAYPPKSVIDKFNDFYEEAYLSQKEIKQETQTLINLRDTLLPKLMSGELMVPCEEEI